MERIQRRVLVLVDGEHYPTVIEAALEELRLHGNEVIALAHLGGTEKFTPGELAASEFSAPLITASEPAQALIRAIEEFKPDAVVDLSDAPILNPKLRMQLASRALAAQIPYEGTDFVFRPPRRERLAGCPSIAVIGTGKRTGKTAISGAIARALTREGRKPLIVAMGRGGPVEPEVIRPHRDGAPTVESLIALADDGRHAASDHIEDAVMAGVTTVGTRRCGGGLAGTPGPSTFAVGVEVANMEAFSEGNDLFIFEGSGSAIPPVLTDATILVMPSTIRTEEIDGYMGLYRLLIADWIVVVHFDPLNRRRQIDDLIHTLIPAPEIVHVVLEPVPDRDISGRRVALATTAPISEIPAIEGHLDNQYGARVVGSTAALSDRSRLLAELPPLLERVDVVATELKAAGVDVVARAALDAGVEVAFINNEPRILAGGESFDSFAKKVRDEAVVRFRAHSISSSGIH